MKKIELSKETLRVLTWQEAAAVAGGVLTDCACPNTLQISCPPPPPVGGTTLVKTTASPVP